MKKLLLIALVAAGCAFVGVPRADAGVHVSVGLGFPIGYGYGYGYGYPYYPAYYAPYPYRYRYYRPYVRVVHRPYYWYNGRRIYRGYCR